MSEYVPSKDDKGVAAIREGVNLLFDRKIPLYKKLFIIATMLGAGAYVIAPADVIADAIPFFGMTDDFAAMLVPVTASHAALRTKVGEIVKTVQVLKVKVSKPNTTNVEKIAYVAAFGYAIYPLDPVPDAIPFVGTIDDLLVMLVPLLPKIGELVHTTIRQMFSRNRGSSRTIRTIPA